MPKFCFKHGTNFSISKFNIIDRTCVFGDNVSIGPFCEIKNDVSVGSNTLIQGKSRIAKGCRIGSNVTLKYGTILTSNVLISDNVFFGPNTIVFGDKRSREASSAGTNGTTTIGENCYIGGGATIMAGVSICNNVIIGAMTFVNKDITESGTYIGIPAKRIK